MHFDFMTRGEYHCVNRFAAALSSQYFHWTTKDKKGKTRKLIAPATLQPIQLWSLVFPNQNLDMVLNTLNPVEGYYGKKMTTQIAMLRKLMGSKKIPKWDTKARQFPISKKYVQIIGIGIREDQENVYGNEML